MNLQDAIRKIFEEIGAGRIQHPERVAITLDHAVPAPTTRHAQNHAEIREWVQMQNIAHFFEVGRGICHQVISEEALILPGEVIFGSDSHTTFSSPRRPFSNGVGMTSSTRIHVEATPRFRPRATYKPCSPTASETGSVVRSGGDKMEIPMRIRFSSAVSTGAMRLSHEAAARVISATMSRNGLATAQVPTQPRNSFSL